jgi:outer membrane protein OmpA-like peptidoglycan-associated protein
MNDSFDIVSGIFEGNFYTHQKSILTASEFNLADKKHDIHLYRGDLWHTKVEENYNPDKQKSRNSFLLHNVTNVQFHFENEREENQPKKVFNFEQLLLHDVQIKESWELNGKTYGIITGKLIGKVKEEIKNPEPSNPSEPPKPPPIISNPFKNPIEKWFKPNFPDNPSNNLGCLNLRNGCLSTLLKLLLALLLLLLLFWFIKGCKSNNFYNDDCCRERDSLLIENKKITKELDSLLQLKNQINDSINKEIIQEELDELSSKVYFYGGTTKIRQFSDEQLNKIVDILQKNKNLEVEVRGYYNGNSNSSIDVDRAEEIKKLLISKGLNYNTVSAVGMGQSTIDSENSYNQINIDGEEFLWNRNMRVEIKIIKY